MNKVHWLSIDFLLQIINPLVDLCICVYECNKHDSLFITSDKGDNYIEKYFLDVVNVLCFFSLLWGCGLIDVPLYICVNAFK